MPDQEKGILVTTKTLSAVLGVLAILASMYAGITTVNSFAFRIEKLEADKLELISSINQLSDKLDQLNTKITNLTIALNRLEDRYSRLERDNTRQ